MLQAPTSAEDQALLAAPWSEVLQARTSALGTCCSADQRGPTKIQFKWPDAPPRKKSPAFPEYAVRIRYIMSTDQEASHAKAASALDPLGSACTWCEYLTNAPAVVHRVHLICRFRLGFRVVYVTISTAARAGGDLLELGAGLIATLDEPRLAGAAGSC